MAEAIAALASEVKNITLNRHPLDPLSAAEIDAAVAIIRKEHGEIAFNAVSLKEPPKKELQAWLADPTSTPPPRVADIVALAPGSKVYDGLVDLDAGKIIEWELLEGFQPLVSCIDLIILSTSNHHLDHHGRPPALRTRCPQTPRRHQTMHHLWHRRGRHG